MPRPDAPSGSNYPYMNPVASRGMDGSFNMVGRFPMGMDRSFYGNGSYPGNVQDIQQQLLMQGNNRHQQPNMSFPIHSNSGYPPANDNVWDTTRANQQAHYGPFGASIPRDIGASGMMRAPIPERSFPGNSMSNTAYMPGQSRENTFSVNRDMLLKTSGQKYPPTNQTLISPQKDTINNSETQRLNEIKDTPDRSRKRPKNKQNTTDINITENAETSSGGKKCGVCGEAARSMHFGGMACDSCKAFFRRSVQSGVYKNFNCSEEQKCPVSKGNRKGCQYCRFQKCKTNGMEVKWVMSESDRMQMWKSRLAKQRQVTSEKEKEVELEGLPPSLNPEVAENIKYLTTLQEETFSSSPYPDECWGGTVESLANTFVCICQKLGNFFSKVDDFKKLCKNDQKVLLNSGIAMSIYLHGAHMYDAKNKCWPAEQCKEAFSVPPVSMEMLKEMSGLPELYYTIMKFYDKYHCELKDEVILVLLSLISFYQPDSPNFEDPEAVQNTQEKYLELLQVYLRCKDGPINDRVLFPKLLVGLADVREIVEYHNKVDIKPSINHAGKQQQLSEFRSALTQLTNLFIDSNKGELPQFSSILSPKEKQMQSFRGKNNSALKNDCNAKGKDLCHPYTSIMFGAGIKTDLLLSNPLVELENCIKDGKIDIRKHPRLNLAHSSGNNKNSEQKAIEAPKNNCIDFTDNISNSVVKSPIITVASKKIFPEDRNYKECGLSTYSSERDSDFSEDYGKEPYLPQAYSPEQYTPPQSFEIQYISKPTLSPKIPGPHINAQYEHQANRSSPMDQKSDFYQWNNYNSPVGSPASYKSYSSQASRRHSQSSPGECSSITSGDYIRPSSSEYNYQSHTYYSPSSAREYSPATCLEYSPSTCLQYSSTTSNLYNSASESNSKNQFGSRGGTKSIQEVSHAKSGYPEKKKAVKVLCDVLKQISCSEDQEVIHSLKESLSPEVLLKVAEKLKSTN